MMSLIWLSISISFSLIFKIVYQVKIPEFYISKWNLVIVVILALIIVTAILVINRTKKLKLFIFLSS